jgi:HK97 gp10 family phage protein
VNIDVTIRGMEDVRRTLTELGPREAKNLMRVTVTAMAQDFAKDAEPRMPVESGDLAGNIFHKRERGTRNTLAASVRVASKAFYWRFLEYGQGPDKVEHAMFLQTLQALRPDLNARYLEVFTTKLIAAMKRKAKKQAKGA